MAHDDDRRLIEDYLPIEAISAEARVENSVTQARGYLSKAGLSLLHRWWARRPLVACRAAVYAALVPAHQFQPSDCPPEKRVSLGRANAAKFVERLCQRNVAKADLDKASQHIRAANGGKAPRVLDMFAGGGSIPLEAARLGCEAHAVELNPVAHLVELATLVYPAEHGAELVEAVRRWSAVVRDRAEAEVGDLYPLLPDLYAQKGHTQQLDFKEIKRKGEAKGGDGGLRPVAYLWTRTVPCPNCGATVPLHRQTWLRKKAKGYVALRPDAKANKGVTYELLESIDREAKQAIEHWGFDPSDVSSGGETECPFCLSAVTVGHIKNCITAGRMGNQLMATVTVRGGERGKAYLPATTKMQIDDRDLQVRLSALLSQTGLTLPTEPLQTLRPSPNARGVSAVTRYSILSWSQLFTPRQLLVLLTIVKHVHQTHAEMIKGGMESGLARAVATYLALIVDKVAERGANVCRWDNTHEKIQSPIANGKMPMVWDFPEANPFGGGSGSWQQSADDVIGALQDLVFDKFSKAHVQRGSILSLPYSDEHFDAVVTDPPYYDNVPYADLSDFFYVWLRRLIGDLYPEHFAAVLTPKKSEATALSSRHGGDMAAACREYEDIMSAAFSEAARVLKPGAPLVCVYAHKTTLGWSTLIEALRHRGFMVTEAWPIDTEMAARLHAREAASLASNIFLVARKREGSATGSYEEDVRPDLDRIVRERVDTLWNMDIAGADLVIAAVGAGLRAFTRFDRVEYANGEEVPAEKFLAEVEGVVLEHLLEKIFGLVGAGVSAVDGPSRFYVLWRYTYKAAEMDSGEAIVFTYGQNVELDGPKGLSAGNRALLEKKRGAYLLKDFTERGDHDKLGQPVDDGTPAPLIDTLHRVLWLLENQPRSLGAFLDETRPDTERLRLVAQALAGAGLQGKKGEGVEQLVATTAKEHSALQKLLANWRTLIDQRRGAPGPLFEGKTGA